MYPRTFRLIALIGLLVLGVASRAAAVTVSPSALFIDARSRSGTLTLYNSGTLPEEIEVGFAFGYPVSDANGISSVELRDSAAAGEPSLVPWMRVFPRRLVLQPGQRQTIRVMIQPPADLADGEYWGRIVVRARGGQPPIEETQGEVRMQIDIETAIATAVMYRKGGVQTGVGVPMADAQRTPDGVQLTLDLVRQGNAAYLGRVRAELLDATGNVVAREEDAVAVYRQLRRRFVLKPEGGELGPGYRVRYTVDTERSDLPGGLLKAAPLTATIPVP